MTPEQTKALLAAAPLMLEALDQLMTAYVDLVGYAEVLLPHHTAWREAVNAIAVATGEDA